LKPEFDSSLLRSLRGRDEMLQRSVYSAMQATATYFGHPHLHSGRGIRRLGTNLYECRAGLDLRILFYRQDDRLVFTFAGTHDEIKAYLKNR